MVDGMFEERILPCQRDTSEGSLCLRILQFPLCGSTYRYRDNELRRSIEHKELA